MSPILFCFLLLWLLFLSIHYASWPGAVGGEDDRGGRTRLVVVGGDKANSRSVWAVVEKGGATPSVARRGHHSVQFRRAALPTDRTDYNLSDSVRMAGPIALSCGRWLSNPIGSSSNRAASVAIQSVVTQTSCVPTWPVPRRLSRPPSYRTVSTL